MIKNWLGKKETKKQNRKCPGGCVGIIIKNKEGNILLLERLSIPLGWAPPAGHRENNLPEEQVIAEAREEVCLDVKKVRLLLGPVELMFGCSRPKDTDIKYNCHDWMVYEALEWEGEPKSGELNKIGRVEWFNVSEIKNLELDPVWNVLFKQLGMLM